MGQILARPLYPEEDELVQHRLVIVEDPPLPGSMDDHMRPSRPGNWPGLWAYVLPPTTMRGVLLWKDGRTMVVNSWENYDLYWDADDRVAGGAEVVFTDEDWQLDVMEAAGFLFEAVGPGSNIRYKRIYTPVY